MSDDSIEALMHKLRQFRKERGWEAIHTPENLAISLAVEVGELLEHFQWSKACAESRSTDPETFDALAMELADVAIYTIQLADILELDLGAMVEKKIELNSRKHPRLEK